MGTALKEVEAAWMTFPDSYGVLSHRMRQEVGTRYIQVIKTLLIKQVAVAGHGGSCL